MKNQPIIIGDARSVLRIGPVPLKHRGDWHQRDSDLFAHFIQVNRQISKSRWSAAECRFKRQGGRLLEASFPDIEEFVYAAVYFRQLFSRSRSDQLLRNVCERYQHFVSHAGKSIWVAKEQESFAQVLSRPTFMLPDYSAEALVEAFMYGASIFHGIPNEQCPKRKNFRKIIADHDRELVLYALHTSLKQLQNHVSAIAAVVYQDFSNWIPDNNLPLPDVMWHHNLFACQVKE